MDEPLRYIIRCVASALTLASSSGCGANNLVAGSNDIRLQQIVVPAVIIIVGYKTPGWPTRGIGCDCVVAAAVRAQTVCGTHGNNRRFVTRRVYLAIDLRAVLVLAIISSGSYHDEMFIGDASNRLA